MLLHYIELISETRTPDAPRTLGNQFQVPISPHRTRLICHLLPN